MITLRVQELAKERGLATIYQFEKALKLNGVTARRLWYSTRDGKAKGPPLDRPSLAILEQVADYLGVEIGELFERV